MPAIGLITEYNPFHNGHLYHLKTSKNISSHDPVIAVMNGHFTQRGTLACLDKWQRAKMAVESGVDLVLELPIVAGIRSAHYFAQGAVRVLAATNIVDKIVFGSETGKIKPLKQIASLLAEEPEDFRDFFHDELQKGSSYARARTKAINKYFASKKISFSSCQEKSELQNPGDIASSPNNILGIEYIKNIYRDNLEIEPKTIARKQANYHDEYAGKKSITSATAIRNLVQEGKLTDIKKYMPKNCVEIMLSAAKQGKMPVLRDSFKKMVISTLRRSSRKEILNCPAFSADIVNTIMERQENADNYNELVDNVTSKTFTRSRIKRGLLQLVARLNILPAQEKEVSPKYLRVLALGCEGEKILSLLDKKANLPVITNPSTIINEPRLESNNLAELYLSLEVLATNIYSLFYPDKKNRRTKLDFYTPLIKIDS